MPDETSKPARPITPTKPTVHHAIAFFGDGTSETITPTLDAIFYAGWRFVCHPVNGIRYAWLFQTTDKDAEDPQRIADRVQAGIAVNQKPGPLFLPPKDT